MHTRLVSSRKWSHRSSNIVRLYDQTKSFVDCFLRPIIVFVQQNWPSPAGKLQNFVPSKFKKKKSSMDGLTIWQTHFLLASRLTCPTSVHWSSPASDMGLSETFC